VWEVGSIPDMRFVAIFPVLRRRLGRCYRRNAEPHVANCADSSPSAHAFRRKKVAENAASRPNFGDFCLPARSLAAVVGLSWGGDTAAPHHRAIITTIVEVQEQMEQFKFTFNIGVPQRLHH